MKNEIGIVYSPGYGAGWSTWGRPEMALDQTLANMIEDGKPYSEIEAYCEMTWPDEYLGGLEDCVVEWVEKGTQFVIEEYDGSESVVFNHGNYWMTAE